MQHFLLVKSGIIQNDDASDLHRGQQHRLKPKAKQYAVHCAAVLQWSHNTLLTLSRDDAGSCIFLATDIPRNEDASLRPCIRAVQVLVYSSLINIHKSLFGNGGYNFSKKFTLLLISFFVGYLLFLRVIPKRFSAF